MSVDFSFREFFHPLEICRLRSFLERSQWYPKEELRAYQDRRLREILRHAYRNVPYYRRLFDGLGLKPEDFKGASDLGKLPLLTKDLLRRNFESLKAVNARAYKPVSRQTTGTTGEPVRFLLDKPANVLEFCYYWRHWSWGGYRLHDPVAEFSLHHFINAGINRLSDYSPLTNRMVLNPSKVSPASVEEMTREIRRRGARFLKGTPSGLHAFATLLDRGGFDAPPLNAVFTTGELLMPKQRKAVEDAFGCCVLDSYGHMERTVGISQCALGGYHVNMEYGVLEVDGDACFSPDQGVEGRVVGTSLHNFAMPLIRYDVGDIMENGGGLCGCGRGLPLCGGIRGRTQDVVVTPDGRQITNLFILFNDLKEVRWVQIIQEDLSHMRVELICEGAEGGSGEDVLLSRLKAIMGEGVNVEMDYLPREMLADRLRKKYVPVVSKVGLGAEL